MEPHGAADIAAAMGFLAELMDVAHVQAGGGVAATQPTFGLVGLTRTATLRGGGRVGAVGSWSGTPRRRLRAPGRASGAAAYAAWRVTARHRRGGERGGHEGPAGARQLYVVTRATDAAVRAALAGQAKGAGLG
eukprot:5696446-Pleurochrysis_carterae.AAC.1